MKLRSIILSVISFAILWLPSGTHAYGNETDKLALMGFKSHITEDPQGVLSSWNDSVHFCEWEGITCGHKHQRVTGLSLRSKGLVGPVSPHIGNLSFMRTLDLGNNSFHGGIPQQLGQLSRLRTLILGRNSLVGKLPVNISLCSNLKTLNTSYNHLDGEIPTEVGSLTQLAELYLGHNMLTGSIPPSLGNLTSLENLDLSYNHLSGSVPSDLHRLKSLINLNLTSNYLSGTFPPSIYNISSLEYFFVSFNQLSGSLPAEIGYMLPFIKTFFIPGNQFFGTIPASLFNASTIILIDLAYNGFTGKVPLNVGSPRELEILAFDGNELGSGREGDLDFFTSLANCSSLQHLGMGENNFGGILPLSFGNFSNKLQTLYLELNGIWGVLPNEIEKFKDLILLSMGDNFITGSIPKSIGNLQNLQKLYLNGNQLHGEIPSSLRNMSRLFLLSLPNNNLEGSINSSLGNQKMETLDLSHNRFTGTIPNRELALSVRLINLTLAHNSLHGSIPMEVANLKNLQYLDISENNISNCIPPALSGCSSLEFVYLQGNSLHGLVPSTLNIPKALLELDLSRNNLSGEIPRDLEKSGLRRLNLSFNNIEGEVPIEGIFRNESSFAVFGNQNVCGGIPLLGLPKCLVKTSTKGGIQLALKLVLGMLTPFAAAFVSIIIYTRKRRPVNCTSEQLPKDLMRVSYSDLHRATNGFSPDNLIGMGSYSSVYKGILQEHEGLVAVKVLNVMAHGAYKWFLAECEALREIRHRNLLKVMTVCSSIDFNNNDFKALIFEFMPNGSLESWLHPISEEKCLRLDQRINIANDVAFALDYLHNHATRPIVHCDLKPSNILLCNDMIAQVSDFGLAKFIPEVKLTQENIHDASNSISIRGTIGYIPPEYGIGVKVSAQGDVYSYGIVLLEMLTGKRPTDEMFKNGLSLHTYSKMALREEVMNIIDLRMLSEGTYDSTHSGNQIKEQLASMMRIGVACSMELAEERMDIKTALKEISSIKQSLGGGEALWIGPQEEL